MVFDGVLFYPTSDGTVHALKIATREKVWEYKSKSSVNAFALRAETIVTGGDKGKVRGLSVKTGAELWAFDADDAVDTITIGRTAVYLRTRSGILYALDLQGGKQLWAAKAGGPVRRLSPVTTVKIGTSLAFWNDTLFFVGVDGAKDMLFAIGAQDGKTLWKAGLGSPARSPVVAGGTIYVGTFGMLYAIDSTTGNEIFSTPKHTSDNEGRPHKNVVSAPIPYGDSLVFVSDDGHVYAVR